MATDMQRFTVLRKAGKMEMNKKRVDEYIPRACKALLVTRIVEKETIDASYKGQIASFGAMIATGSVLSAIALFSARGKTDADRTKLMKAIYAVIHGSTGEIADNALFDYVQGEKNRGKICFAKEEVTDAAIALKLAMNLYKPIEKERDGTANT